MATVYLHPDKITAEAGSTMGAPLKIMLERDCIGGKDEITIFTDNHSMTSDLAAAINEIVAKHKALDLEAAE